MRFRQTIYASVLVLGSMSVLLGCATYKKCGLQECPEDQDLSRSVQESINRHAELGAPDSIRVMSVDHVVYLYGQVDAGLQKHAAEAFAWQVAGVKKVVNEIAVQH